VLQSDLLKFGHHGSKNSTTPELLAAVNPQWAIISSGAENPYGHPSPELMQRLRDANVKTLRTDQKRSNSHSLEWRQPGDILLS